MRLCHRSDRVQRRVRAGIPEGKRVCHCVLWDEDLLTTFGRDFDLSFGKVPSRRRLVICRQCERSGWPNSEETRSDWCVLTHKPLDEGIGPPDIAQPGGLQFHLEHVQPADQLVA